LGSNIEFIGEVGPKDRDDLLGNALAFLHPTTIPEPFGLTLIEAQATGTPVIGFGKGSVAELVRHRETGFVVHDVTEAVEAVHKLETIDRNQCRRWIEEYFTIESMTNGYIKVYEKILAQQ
jgi:glycosyltransferase involved in cell wall biosynthesis